MHAYLQSSSTHPLLAPNRHIGYSVHITCRFSANFQASTFSEAMSESLAEAEKEFQAGEAEVSNMIPPPKLAACMATLKMKPESSFYASTG